MQPLTDEGRRIVDDIAGRTGFSTDAVTAMLYAVAAGYGNQAQFNHPEFGGMGQWSNGGMIMIGDMFNNSLKSRVAGLCQELAGVIQGQPLFAMPTQVQSQSQGGSWQQQPIASYGSSQQQSSGGSQTASLFVPGSTSANWWPQELGMAASTGAQNAMRYAYFPALRRLAIDNNGHVDVYDCGDHQIGGFGQQQGGDQSLTFTSQYGVVRVADLPRVTQGATQPQVAVSPYSLSPSVTQPSAQTQSVNGLTASADIFALIEKLSDLHRKGILTDTEFETKKADLLSRL